MHVVIRVLFIPKITHYFQSVSHESTMGGPPSVQGVKVPKAACVPVRPVRHGADQSDPSCDRADLVVKTQVLAVNAKAKRWSTACRKVNRPHIGYSHHSPGTPTACPGHSVSVGTVIGRSTRAETVKCGTRRLASGRRRACCRASTIIHS